MANRQPGILFMQDTNNDDKVDITTVVATGFGRDDTHELPNSLTFGTPEGYLYGFNVSSILLIKYKTPRSARTLQLYLARCFASIHGHASSRCSVKVPATLGALPLIHWHASL